MSNHPITPPDELVGQWTSLANEEEGQEVWSSIATQAVQWGADQQLEACCEWLRSEYEWGLAAALRLDAELRPDPPSLKEQALKGLDDISTFALGQLEGTSDYEEYKKIADTVRKALEAL